MWWKAHIRREKAGFMRYRIMKQNHGLSVQIDDVLGQVRPLSQQIRQCRQSASTAAGFCRLTQAGRAAKAGPELKSA